MLIQEFSEYVNLLLLQKRCACGRGERQTAVKTYLLFKEVYGSNYLSDI